MTRLPRIVPCLWLDSEAEAAARHYTAIFPESGIDQITYYGEEGFEHHRRPAGSVMTVEFHLAGQRFTALNGGPLFKPNEAISFQIFCDTQEEIDHYWSKLSAGGAAGPCGWLKDRFGVSWQVVPSVLPAMLTDPDRAKVGRVTNAFLGMAKLDLAALE